MKKTDSKLQHVTLLRRIGAILYDTILLITVLIFASLFAVVLFKITPQHPWFFIYKVYIFSICFLFFAWPWIQGGQTLGMKTWRIKLVHNNNEKVYWMNALIRFLVSIVSWLALGLGFIWALFDNEKRTWHDIASKTKLVRI